MKYYFAPLEGITDYIYRGIHRRYFPGVDRYFTPFISPTQNHIFSHREKRQVLPENNAGVSLVPQLLTKNPVDFLWAANVLADMGYGEVNLNLGCPSGTVTAKGKGAGLLSDRDALRWLLDEIFADTPVNVSVKTRLGMEQPEEFPPILEIYNDYPICELIIHPRTKKQMYQGNVHLEDFAAALTASRAAVCYNGDILTAADCRAVEARFPGVTAIMIGRGLVADPAMLSGQRDKHTLHSFHDELCRAYCDAFGGPASALHRMKAIWSYMLSGFRDGRDYERRLIKAKKWPDFLALTEEIFAQAELVGEREAQTVSAIFQA